MTTALAPLYVISADRAALLDRLVDADGVISPEIQAELDALDQNFDAKLAACAVFAKNLKAEMKKHRDEQAQQKLRADRLERAYDSLLDYTMRCMEAAEKDRVDGVARIQANSRASVIFAGDPRTLPEEFQVVTVDINKEGILEAVKIGHPIPENVTVVRGRHIRLL